MHQLTLSLMNPPTPAKSSRSRPSPLDRQRAAQKRDTAMQQANQHANDAWKQAALDAIKQAAQQNPRLTTDAVVALLQHSPARTHEPRALGPLMRRAAKLGWLAPTTEFEKSNAVSRHRAPKQVWKSLLYQP